MTKFEVWNDELNLSEQQVLVRKANIVRTYLQDMVESSPNLENYTVIISDLLEAEGKDAKIGQILLENYRKIGSETLYRTITDAEINTSVSIKIDSHNINVYRVTDEGRYLLQNIVNNFMDLLQNIVNNFMEQSHDKV